MTLRTRCAHSMHGVHGFHGLKYNVKHFFISKIELRNLGLSAQKTENQLCVGFIGCCGKIWVSWQNLSPTQNICNMLNRDTENIFSSPGIHSFWNSICLMKCGVSGISNATNSVNHAICPRSKQNIQDLAVFCNIIH